MLHMLDFNANLYNYYYFIQLVFNPLLNGIEFYTYDLPMSC